MTRIFPDLVAPPTEGPVPPLVARVPGPGRVRRPHIAILGSVGVPARYGGFETLAEHLVRYHAETDRPERLTVYCSAPAYPDRPDRFGRADLAYSRLRANGVSSIAYDTVTLARAIATDVDVALLLGVSGAVALPLLRRATTRIATHVDGLEWRREKWTGPARAYLRWSERLAVRHSDAVIADSRAIADHLARDHGIAPEVIAYGGDHATQVPEMPSPPPPGLPEGYALALCRIVPENNVAMILDAFARTGQPLVFVGNWGDSRYGRGLRARYGGHPAMRLLDPVHAPGPKYALRMGASAYVHGHSAGGTNPALVEMMHVGHPVLALDCAFNRETTRNGAQYFDSAGALAALLRTPPPIGAGARLRAIAEAHFRWDIVGAQYFELFSRMLDRAG